MTKTNPTLITDTDRLQDICTQFANASFLAIDTEFMRETTYYPQLCLIQISDGQHAVAIDPLSPDISLSCLWSLLQDKAITKVFHAGRQDLEIFVHLMGCLPEPIYDTQIAAMVCGLGDQVGYDKLVQHFEGVMIDKSSRFTDWSKRPLSDKQLSYALADVTHLAEIYPKMVSKLAEDERTAWVDEELMQLASIDLYQPDPDKIWQKIKIRNGKPAMLNRLKYLASWRETEAQRRNMPRNRLLRDETLLDLAASNPKSNAALDKIRGFPGGQTGKLAAPILSVLKNANAVDQNDWPSFDHARHKDKPPQAVMELLRVLLKYVCDAENVAPRLLATSDELEALALSDTADIKALRGWRYEIFGKQALELKAGNIALSVKGKTLRLITLNEPDKV